MLVDEEAASELSVALKATDFYVERARLAFQVISRLVDKGSPVDFITIMDEVSSMSEQSAETLDVAWLMGAADTMPSAAFAQHYAVIVKELSALRKIIAITYAAQNNAFNRSAKSHDILSKLDEDIRKIYSVQRGEFIRISERKSERADAIDRHIHSAGVTGLATGFVDVDRMIGGLKPGTLNILAARPGMGKSAFAAQVSAEVATHGDVLLISLEMLIEQIGMRLVRGRAHVDLDRKNLLERDFKRVVDTIDALDQLNLYVNDGTQIDEATLKSKVFAFAGRHKNLKLLVVDYIGLVETDDDNLNRALGKLTRTLLHIARRLQIPVLALSQLNRAVENRANKRPVLSDLRDSGAIEQDAHVVMFVYRDEYYNTDSAEPGVAELIIAKNREGRIGTVKLGWIAEHVSFANLARTSQYQSDPDAPLPFGDAH